MKCTRLLIILIVYLYHAHCDGYCQWNILSENREEFLPLCHLRFAVSRRTYFCKNDDGRTMLKTTRQLLYPSSSKWNCNDNGGYESCEGNKCKLNTVIVNVNCTSKITKYTYNCTFQYKNLDCNRVHWNAWSQTTQYSSNGEVKVRRRQCLDCDDIHVDDELCGTKTVKTEECSPIIPSTNRIRTAKTTETIKTIINRATPAETSSKTKPPISGSSTDPTIQRSPAYEEDTNSNTMLPVGLVVGVTAAVILIIILTTVVVIKRRVAFQCSSSKKEPLKDDKTMGPVNAAVYSIINKDESNVSSGIAVEKSSQVEIATSSAAQEYASLHSSAYASINESRATAVYTMPPDEPQIDDSQTTSGVNQQANVVYSEVMKKKTPNVTDVYAVVHKTKRHEA